MAGEFLGVLSFLAFAAAMWVAVRTTMRTPPDAPLVGRTKAEATAEGPVARFVADADDDSLDPFAHRTLDLARAQLSDWLARRSVSVAQAIADPRAAGIPPVLAHALARSPPETWWEAQARGGFRGPRFLFVFWYPFHRPAGSRRARLARYLDLVTQKLVETVNA